MRASPPPCQAAAAGLTWRGLRPRDVVGIMVPDAVSFAIAMHAVRAAGGVPSPVDAALCAVETAGQLAESGARMVITSPPLAEIALAAADRSWVRQVFSFADAAGTTRFSDLLGLDMIRPSRGRPEDVALLPFSRGQDGRLRPAPVTHREYIDSLDRADQMARITGRRPRARHAAVRRRTRPTRRFVDCALLRGATVVAVRKQEIAMAAIAHQCHRRDRRPALRGRARRSAHTSTGSMRPAVAAATSARPRVCSGGESRLPAGHRAAQRGTCGCRRQLWPSRSWGRSDSSLALPGRPTIRSGQNVVGRAAISSRQGLTALRGAARVRRLGGASYGVLSTIVVLVDTFADALICWSSSSSAAGEATRTLSM